MSNKAIVTVLDDVNFQAGSLGKLYRDPVLNEGTILAFDLLNPYSFPRQGNPIPGDIVKNLMPNAPQGTFVSAGSYSNGGVYLDSDTGDSLEFDDSSLNLSSGPNFVFITWLSLPAIPKSGGTFAFGKGFGGGTGSNQYMIALLGANGDQVSGFVNGYIGNNITPPVIAKETPIQIAISYEDLSTSSRKRLYVNGSEVGNYLSTIGIPSTSDKLEYGDSSYTSGVTAKIYRSILENLSVSGRTVAEAVQQDWNWRNGVFSH